MRKLILGISILTLAGVAHSQYFPPHVLEKRSSRWPESKRPWYSAQLKALNEPSLFEMKTNREAEVYRFLWLRTFHHPIAIRLEAQPDGTGILTIKMSNGAGGYAPGSLIDNRSIKISPEQMRAFRVKLDESRFWSLPNPVKDQAGTDGAQWSIEGIKEGTYHVVDRWEPRSPIRDLGLMLAFEFAKLDIPTNEIY